MAITIKELAGAIGAEVVGDGSVQVQGANTLEEAGPGEISFLSNPRYMKQLHTTKASAVVVAPNISVGHVTLLRARDPYYAFSQALVTLYGFRKHPHEGIHPRAFVDPTATIGQNSVLYPGVYVGPRARIGRDCILYPNAVVYDDCVLGDRVTVHANSSIGQDGYGYATHKDASGVPVHHKIPQIGNVILEDDVEIGANATIDRAAMGSTVIGRGTKVGDLVTVGHNTRIGPHGLIVAQVGIAGSVVLGHHATLAGQVGVTGHLKIGDAVTIGAQSGVMNHVPDQSTMIGSPAMTGSHARRVYSAFTQLPELVDRLKKLEDQVAELGATDSPENESGIEK